MGDNDKHETELLAMQDPESWDDGEVRPPARAPRAVVSVAFARADFEAVAQAAAREGMKTSEFIRRAALGRAVGEEQDPVQSVTGLANTRYQRLDRPAGTYVRVRIHDNTAQDRQPSDYASSWQGSPRG